MKCLLCGIEGDDVEFQFEYVGGKGHMETGPICNDRVECWGRWDRTNGMAEKETVRELEVTAA